MTKGNTETVLRLVNDEVAGGELNPKDFPSLTPEEVRIIEARICEVAGDIGATALLYTDEAIEASGKDESAKPKSKTQKKLIIPGVRKPSKKPYRYLFHLGGEPITPEVTQEDDDE